MISLKFDADADDDEPELACWRHTPYFTHTIIERTDDMLDLLLTEYTQQAFTYHSPYTICG